MKKLKKQEKVCKTLLWTTSTGSFNCTQMRTKLLIKKLKWTMELKRRINKSYQDKKKF